MARQDLLRRHVEGDVGVVEWDGLEEELGGDGKLVNGGNNPLLSLKGTMSQVCLFNNIVLCTCVLYVWFFCYGPSC